MRNLIIIFLFLTLNAEASKLEKTLQDFAYIVSEYHDINILISDDIDPFKYLFIIPNSNNKIMLNAFKRMLDLKNLQFIKEDGFYYIDKKEEIEEVEEVEEIEEEYLYYFTLNNLVFEDIESIFKLYELIPIYLKSTNSFSIKTTEKIYKEIKDYIAILDKDSDQVQFKITVLETNLNNLKDRGTQISLDMQSIDKYDDKEYNYFLNLITMPYTASSNILSTSKLGFYGVLRYLNQNGFTNIENSPILTAKSRQKVSFSSVQNIPYLVQTQKIDDTKVSESNSYEYKDVGLKIDIAPIVLGEKIEFDLNIVIEDILSSNDKTPIVSKKSLESNYTLQKGELLILSGINRNNELVNEYGIPLLKDIFIVGELFKYESKSTSNNVLTITIEVL